MNTSYNFADAHRLLIKPFDRLGFIVIFILTTGLSQVVAYFVCHQSTFDLLLERSQMQYGIATGIIAGMFIGASQWLILRKYISDWKWILVVGVNITFLSTIQANLDIWKESILSSANSLSEPEMLIGLTFNLLALIGSFFISGYLQWYILRPYITKARWWIFIPFIAVLLGVFPFGLSVLTRGLLPFNITVIQLTMLPATQAIGFCILQRKSISDHPIIQSSLALASDIVNYWEIKDLEKILYANISRIWKTDLSASIGQLTYLVGINHSGDIITYQPINHASIDNVDQTPLPELSSEPNGTALTVEDLTSFAKFQVVFTPPGTVQIYSWRGIPLIWLGVAAYLGILGISFLCAKLKIVILPLYG